MSHTLGPYLVINNATRRWVFFIVSETGFTSYQADYIENNSNSVQWQQQPIADKTPLYVYDPREKQSTCFIRDVDQLFHVPKIIMKDATSFCNQVQMPRITEHGVEWDLANGKKASHYSVKVELFLMLLR